LKVAAALAKGKTLKEAGLEAGYSALNPAQSAFQAVEQLRKNETAIDIMHRLGLGTESLIEKHIKPLLAAEMVRGYVIKNKLVERTYIDNRIRLGATSLCADILGIKIAEQENDGTKRIRAVVLDLSHRPPQQLPPPMEPPDISKPGAMS
jgi:hypothetical protein